MIFERKVCEEGNINFVFNNLQLYFGLCIPSTCSNTELEIVLKDNLDNFFNETGITMEVRVEPEMCQIKENKPYSTGTIISL
jgi:hypothetical protein